ncbi:MAG: pectate lyase [Muribaculaceae bacterium]|nr:pectate lyase [Muribaculaceae bacterium]
MKKINVLIMVLAMVITTVSLGFAAPKNWKATLRETDPEFFKTERAKMIGDNLLLFQRETGGWQKNTDMTYELSPSQRDSIAAQKSRQDDSTIDNDATTLQMQFLARLYDATGEQRFKDGFNKALDYLLSGQYENGGWPQFWPVNEGYQVHITYNDDAIANILKLFNEILNGSDPYQPGLVDEEMHKKLRDSFNRGIECILITQIMVNGEPTVWCQQHDHVDYKPAPARTYELPSFCTQESAAIVEVLMSIPNPDQRVRKAIHGAMKWFDDYKLEGVALERKGHRGDPDFDIFLVERPGADPLWARFYDLENCRPFVCDRDGVPRERLDQIGTERRFGYSWYNTRPAALYPLYEEWKTKNNE